MPIKVKKQFIDIGRDSYEPAVVVKEGIIDDPLKLLKFQ